MFRTSEADFDTSLDVGVLSFGCGADVCGPQDVYVDAALGSGKILH